MGIANYRDTSVVWYGLNRGHRLPVRPLSARPTRERHEGLEKASWVRRISLLIQSRNPARQVRNAKCCGGLDQMEGSADSAFPRTLVSCIVDEARSGVSEDSLECERLSSNFPEVLAKNSGSEDPRA